MKHTVNDPLTGEPFIPKRNDQKFATRENQIRFNNNKARAKRRAKARIDRAMDTNRNILKKILGNDKEIIRSYDFLLGAGYNFGVSSHTILREDNNLWNCIYEYAIIKTESGKIRIAKL